MAVPGSVRADYLERMQARIAFYRRELGLAGIDYCQLETSQPLELGLMAYLHDAPPSALMFGISFLSPLFLIGAVAAAVPILLHLFHRKTEVVIDFPAVQLLTRAPVQQHRRRRLRELLLLALRVVALVLLAVSFARPYLAGAVAPDSAPITVIAVDRSLSLSAPGQYDRAREAARRALAAAPASHAVALVSFAHLAEVVVEPTTDRSAVAAAIAKLSASGDGTRYRTALLRVSEALGARDGRVVIVTDLQQSGWEANDDGGLPDGVDVEVIGIAPPPGNLALTSADLRDRRVIASIQNFGNSEARTTVELTRRRQANRPRGCHDRPAGGVGCRAHRHVAAHGRRRSPHRRSDWL